MDLISSGWTDGMDGRIGGWTDGMDGRTNGWTDGWIK